MADTRPNILLITSEDNGPHMGCYGETNVQTPRLDELAASGARFNNAYVTQAVCSPGRASILTGLYPHQNGQIGLASHRFSMFSALPNIPMLLKDAGYRTGRMGKLHVLPESAFSFDWVWRPDQHNGFRRRDVVKTSKEAGWFMRADDEPFFLMVNYADAHLQWHNQDCGLPEQPLTAEDVHAPSAVGVDTPRLREQAAAYYNCVSRLDTGIGILLDELEKSGQADRTIVIYLADHGPHFSRGKCCSYELSLRTPLMVRWPGVSVPGTVRDELVSQIDVLPTVMDATGVTMPEGLPGRSLRPLLGDDTSDNWRTHLFAEWNTSHPHPLPGTLNPQRVVRDERYKLIVNLLPGQRNPVEQAFTEPTPTIRPNCTQQDEIDAAPEHIRNVYARWRHPPEMELYDLVADPDEFHNLADDPVYAAIRRQLHDALRQWQTETADPFADPEKLQQFIDEHARVAGMEGSHRSPVFRWQYLDYLNGLAPEAST